MFWSGCDLNTAFEDGGLGGLVVVIAWLVKHFFFTPKNPGASNFQSGPGPKTGGGSAAR